MKSRDNLNPFHTFVFFPLSLLPCLPFPVISSPRCSYSGERCELTQRV